MTSPSHEHLNASTSAPLSERTASVTSRTRDRLVVLLAVTSGATDAIGLIALGSAFTSVMTGNMVIAGVATAERDVALLALTLSAIACFMIGAALGARVAGAASPGDATWPRQVTAALRIELGLFIGFAVAWWTLGSVSPSWSHIPFIGVNAIALGLQSSAIQRFGVSGLSTTYLTGTLTTIVIRLTQGRGLREVRHSITILGGLVLGAGIATFLLNSAPALAPLTQLLTLGTVVLVVGLKARSRR